MPDAKTLIEILKKLKAGVPLSKLCREHGVQYQRTYRLTLQYANATKKEIESALAN